jgi:hypothetical protein
LKKESRFNVLFLIYLPVSGIYFLQKIWWGMKKGEVAGVVLKVNLISAHFADEKEEKVIWIVVKCKST